VGIKFSVKTNFNVRRVPAPSRSPRPPASPAGAVIVLLAGGAILAFVLWNYARATTLERDYAASPGCASARLMQAAMPQAVPAGAAPSALSSPCAIVAGVVAGKRHSGGKTSRNYFRITLRDGGTVEAKFRGWEPAFYERVNPGDRVWLQMPGGRAALILWGNTMAQTLDFPATRIRNLRFLMIMLALTLAFTAFVVWKNFKTRAATLAALPGGPVEPWRIEPQTNGTLVNR